MFSRAVLPILLLQTWLFLEFYFSYINVNNNFNKIPLRSSLGLHLMYRFMWGDIIRVSTVSSEIMIWCSLLKFFCLLFMLLLLSLLFLLFPPPPSSTHFPATVNPHTVACVHGSCKNVLWLISLPFFIQSPPHSSSCQSVSCIYAFVSILFISLLCLLDSVPWRGMYKVMAT